MNIDYAGFGRYLQGQRLMRGLSLDDVAQKTKIPPTLIGALESGQSERFPERIFVLNYIRSYATVVGLPPDEALTRFVTIPDAPRKEPFDPAALETERRERASRTLWVTLAVFVVLTALVALNAMHEVAIRYAHR